MEEKNQKEKEEKCPLCDVSEETLDRLKKERPKKILKKKPKKGFLGKLLKGKN